MRLSLFQAFWVLLLTASLVQAASPESGAVLRVLHSTGGNFTLRGEIQLKGTHVTHANMEQTLDAAFLDELHDAAESGLDYLVRVEVAPDSGKYVQGFISACDMYSSNLQDTMVLYLSGSGEVESVDISTSSGCRPVTKRKKLAKFKTAVVLKHPKAGPAVHTDDYLAALRRQKDTPQEEGRSWRYWLYLLPLYMIVMQFLMGNRQPAGQQQQPQQQQRAVS